MFVLWKPRKKGVEKIRQLSTPPLTKPNSLPHGPTLPLNCMGNKSLAVQYVSVQESAMLVNVVGTLTFEGKEFHTSTSLSLKLTV